MFTTRLRALSVFVVLAAAGSGLLLAQSPQAVGTWVGVGAADNPFGIGASVPLTDGRTLIVGGAGADGAATNAVAIFDAATNQFAIAGTLLSARTGHTATLLKDGRVLVTGGTTNSLVSTDIELFDPSTGASALVAQMAEPRRGHVAALLQNGGVLIAGGYTSGDAVLQSAFIFDPATNSVSPTPGGLNVARASASATRLIDGRVVIVGGTDGTNDLASAEIYDPSRQSFSTVSTQLSVPVRGHSAVLLPHNGSVLVAGGTSNGLAQAGAELFLPAEFPNPFSWGIGQFAPTAAMSAARSSAIAGPTATEGYAVVTGGGSNDVERYRFATIKTDKDDYAPGEQALITGTGWQPEERVTLTFQEDPAVHEDYVLTVTADGGGNIYHDQWAPEEHDLGVRFYLMATGQQSGRRAQTTFTDGNRIRFSTDNAATNAFPLALSSVASNQCVSLFVQEQQGGNTSTAPASGRAVNLSSTPSGATFYPSADCTGSPITQRTIQAGSFSIPFSFRIATSTTTSYTITGDTSDFSGDNDARATITVTAASVATTTSINAATITYGQNGSVTVTVSANSGSNTPTGDVSLSVDSGTPVTKTLVNGSYTFTDADVPELATPSAGNHSLSASYAGATGFNSSGPTAGTLTVGQAPVTATAGSGSGTYNGLTHSPDSCVVSGPYVGDLTCENAPSAVGPNVGTYAITPVVSGTGLTNYAITSVDGSYTIDPAPVTATAGSGSGTYNGLTHSPDSCVVSGPYVGDVTCANNPATVGPNVGTFAIAPVVSGTGVTNYAITLVNGSYTIDPVPVTATGGSSSGTYNGLTHSPSACVVSGTYTGDLTCANYPAAVGPNVGTFAVAPVVSGSGLTNYAITLVNGSFTIDPAPVTATAGSGSGTYNNGLTHSPSACVVSGTYTGDLTCANNPATVGPNVGTFAIAPVISGTGLTNYAITSVNGSYSIDPAPVTATGGSGSGTYNGLTHSPSACVVSGTYTGDLACANNPLTVGPNVGTFAIAPAVTGTGLSNYAITLVNGSFTINPAPVTATGGNGSGTYNGLTHSPSACVVSGTYTGDLACANNPLTVGPDVGTFAIAPAVTGTGLSNYAITSVNGSYTISKAPVTATAGSGSGAFSGFTQSPSACTVTGVYTGDLTCANNPASVGPGVGTYVIVPVVSGTGLGNFYITAVNGSYTIAAWHLTGFYQPVGMPNSVHTPPGGTLPVTGILNTIKGGQTVPLKFEIFETIGGVERTSVSAVLPFTLTPVACDGTSYEDPVDFTTTGGTSLRYDALEGQFIQNWQSPKPAGKCYRATMTALDGSSISAFFKTK